MLNKNQNTIRLHTQRMSEIIFNGYSDGSSTSPVLLGGGGCRCRSGGGIG